MKSCRILALAIPALATAVVGCVPYQTHEELAYEYNRVVKMNEDLRAKYNRLLTGVGTSADGASTTRIRYLEDELESSQRTIVDLERKLDENQSVPFDRADQSGVRYIERGSEGQLILSDLLFKSGSADIGSKGRAALDDLARLLKSKYAGEGFHLAGHTDNAPIKRSGHKHNHDLGFKRAENVFSFLVNEHGFSEAQFRLTTFGPAKPRVPNTTAENMALNRRVEIFRIPQNF